MGRLGSIEGGHHVRTTFGDLTHSKKDLEGRDAGGKEKTEGKGSDRSHGSITGRTK